MTTIRSMTSISKTIRGLIVPVSAAAILLAVAVPFASASLITGSLSTYDGGLIGGDEYATPPVGDGYLITWLISPNADLTWHYRYTLTTESGADLTPLTSHAILQLSANIEPEDLLNTGGDVSGWAFDTFGPHPSNPGFPAGKSIYGVKFNLGGDQTIVEFDATRRPMWGDFYAKGGKDSYVCNADIGVAVANQQDFLGIPLDAGGRSLSKILTPDTVETIAVPEPAALSAVGLGLFGLLGLRLRRR